MLGLLSDNKDTFPSQHAAGTRAWCLCMSSHFSITATCFPCQLQYTLGSVMKQSL